MKMTSGKTALDKLYKRRDRYEMPDWQREEVWDVSKKQKLIDTVLRGWKLPKFYFYKISDSPSEYEVVDGQQRLTAIWEFFSNQLALDANSKSAFKAEYYKDLSEKYSDAFDDFEIEFDEIHDASEKDIREFFQRLQEGLPLTSSEKLNSVHSALRDYCRRLAKHKFFTKSVVFGDKRYAHFDVVSKVLAIEIGGINTSLRFGDLKKLFEEQEKFSNDSEIAKRVKRALDFAHKAFPSPSERLKNRGFTQSLLTLSCRLVEKKNSKPDTQSFRNFVNKFSDQLVQEIEKGTGAKDSDFLAFQRTVNANTREGAKIRHAVLLKKLATIENSLWKKLPNNDQAESSIQSSIKQQAKKIQALVKVINEKSAASTGKDLFKLTNKSSSALVNLNMDIKGLESFNQFIDHCYYLFWEAPKSRIADPKPVSFVDVNTLRTGLSHDVDHGKEKEIEKKKMAINKTFKKYGGGSIPEASSPEELESVQLNILAAIGNDLEGLVKSL